MWRKRGRVSRTEVIIEVKVWDFSFFFYFFIIKKDKYIQLTVKTQVSTLQVHLWSRFFPTVNTRVPHDFRCCWLNLWVQEPWIQSNQGYGKNRHIIWSASHIFLPGKSHGQRSLEGYSSWGHKESDTTEQLTLLTFDCVESWCP